jgi:hypothetical protein
MNRARNLNTDSMRCRIGRHDERSCIQPMVATTPLAPAQRLLNSGFAKQTAELTRDSIRDRMPIDSLKAVQHELVDAQRT